MLYKLEDTLMESWRKVFRDAVAPILSTPCLKALYQGLRDDDPTLIQNATTLPPPLHCVMEWPVEGACALTYAGWKGGELETDTVGCAEEFFAKICFEIDQRLGEPAGCRWWLNFWDETPREELKRLVLPELERVLEERERE